MKMKNKREEQIANKKKHREELRRNRRTAPILERSEPTMLKKPKILIVCEGKNTETSYFEKFKLTSATIVPVGEGYNTISLVNRAKYLSEQKQYEKIWCVFDKDDFDVNDFNNAIVLANSYDFGVAYSNQAFEYWFILHFNDHQGGGINRKDYHEIINKLIKPFDVKYDGNGSKLVEDDFFELLDGYDENTGQLRKILAISRAKRNYEFHAPNLNPAIEESTTTVFRIIEELLEYV